jgi:hypothetical protein
VRFPPGDPELYEDLLRQGARRSWDEEAADIQVSQLDQTLLLTYYNGPPDSSSLQSDQVVARRVRQHDVRPDFAHDGGDARQRRRMTTSCAPNSW